MFPWTQLTNGLVIGIGAAVSEHASKKMQLPERLIAFGRAVLPELGAAAGAAREPGEVAGVGAVAPGSPPIVVEAESAASAAAARQATDAKLDEIEARRRAEEAAAEAAAAKAKADAATKAAGGKKHCLCVSSERPWVSTGEAQPEVPGVGCAGDHMCDKCTLNHVTEAAKASPLLSDAEIDYVALAVPGEVFATEAPEMPMPAQPFSEQGYQRDFDAWSGARQAWQRHRATAQAMVGAVADDLAECQKITDQRGRQSMTCAQQLEEARAALEQELRAIAALQPSVGQAIDAERRRRGLRGFFSGLSAGHPVGQGPALSTAATATSASALIQCQATLTDLNLKTQACEADLPKVRAALKVAQARRQELEARSRSASQAAVQAARAAAEKAALEAQRAMAEARAATEAARAAAQQPAPATTVMTPYGPVTYPPQAAPPPAAPMVPPQAPAAATIQPAWSLADDEDVRLRFSSEYSSQRGGDYDLDAEMEEIGEGELSTGGRPPLFDGLDLYSPPSSSVFGPGPGPVGCGCG